MRRPPSTPPCPSPAWLRPQCSCGCATRDTGGESPGAASTTTLRRRTEPPELTKSLPPLHGPVMSRSDNRDMRLPSYQHARVSRSLVLRAVLGALLAAVLAAAPAADAGSSAVLSKAERSVFVSKGVGRQVFT